MKTNSFVPLPSHITKRNGGQTCDMAIGPCACGAWHSESEWEQYVQLQNDRRSFLADQVESAYPHLT